MNAQFPAPDKTTKIEALLILEAKTREAATLSELQFLIVNETRKLIECRQILLHRGSPFRAGWRIEKISSVSQVDRNAPLIKYLATEIKTALRKEAWDQTEPIDINFKTKGKDEAYPFQKGIYIPMKNQRGSDLGGISLLSENKISKQEIMLATRLASTYAHAWSALKPTSKTGWYLLSKRNLLIASILLILVGFIPVPLTVLAPVEVVARDALVITAPIEAS